MPQAKIKINGVIGSNTDLPINTLVLLDNVNTGGELTYAWTILDQPPGAADALSNPAIQNPTFTPKKEGTYLVKLVVNAALPTEQTDQVVAAVLQLKTRKRVPAAGETLEADTADGWAAGLNELWRFADSSVADNGVLVGVAGAAGLLAGNVLRCTSVATIKSGLPGEERVPGFTLAHANVAGEIDEPLVVLISGVNGAANPANGDLIRVRSYGVDDMQRAGAPAVGDLVYLSDAGLPALVSGTLPRILGSVAQAGGGLWRLWFDGADRAVVALAANVTTAAGPAWKDGTANPGANVQAQLDKIVTDLVAAAGSDRIATAIYGDLPAGSIQSQIRALWDGKHGMITKDIGTEGWETESAGTPWVYSPFVWANSAAGASDRLLIPINCIGAGDRIRQMRIYINQVGATDMIEYWLKKQTLFPAPVLATLKHSFSGLAGGLQEVDILAINEVVVTRAKYFLEIVTNNVGIGQRSIYKVEVDYDRI